MNTRTGGQDENDDESSGDDGEEEDDTEGEEDDICDIEGGGKCMHVSYHNIIIQQPQSMSD